MDVFEADERDEKDDATQDSDPEDGAHEVVEDEVLGLERTGRAGVHGDRLSGIGVREWYRKGKGKGKTGSGGMR